METLTLEKSIEICNAINTAIAKGYTVKVKVHWITVGAIISKKRLVFVHRLEEPPNCCHLIRFISEQLITATKGSETIVIHEPSKQKGNDCQDCGDQSDQPDNDSAPLTESNPPERLGFLAVIFKKIISFWG